VAAGLSQGEIVDQAANAGDLPKGSFLVSGRCKLVAKAAKDHAAHLTIGLTRRNFACTSSCLVRAYRPEIRGRYKDGVHQIPTRSGPAALAYLPALKDGGSRKVFDDLNRRSPH
jgi:hypothetical protein